jgi:hypothetical protein
VPGLLANGYTPLKEYRTGWLPALKFSAMPHYPVKSLNKRKAGLQPDLFSINQPEKQEEDSEYYTRTPSVEHSIRFLPPHGILLCGFYMSINLKAE